AATDEISAGRLPVPRYDSRSYVLIKTSSPSFQRLWQPKSRPGRYSDRMKDLAGTPRISPQYLIQLRACAGVCTGSAPSAPAPVRTRHHSGAPVLSLRKMPAISLESSTG